MEIVRLRSSGAVGLAPDSAVRLVRDLNWSTYKPSLGTTNAVLLGELDQVRDPALRAAILSWPSAVDESAPERAALHQLGDGILLVVRGPSIASRLRHIQSVHGGYEEELLATRETLVRSFELLARRSTAGSEG